MPKRLHHRYLEAEVMSADPLKLVQMMYRGAIDSVAAARRYVIAGKIRERSQAITRAWTIINQLTVSLDHTAGGELSRNLAELYAYMQTRLLEANSQQTEPPLAEVEKLLSTLLEAWYGIVARPAGGDHTPEYDPVSCSY